MSEIMAGFGEKFVQTQIMSENNAVKYKLSVAAGLSSSVPSNGYILLQDKALGDQSKFVGITVSELDVSNNTIVSRKTFELKNNDVTGANKSFIDFMNILNSKPNTLVIFTTDGRLYSSSILDDWFKANASVAWPGQWLCSKYPCSYVAFYSTSRKKIIQENATYSDGVTRPEDIRAQLEIVYDKFNDIGVTGFAKRIIEEIDEVSSDNGFEFKRYPSGAPIIAPIKDYDFKIGAKLKATFELFSSKELIDAGQTTRLSFRWFTGSTLISSVSDEIPAGQSERWIKFERYLDVPNNADGFTVIAARYPRQDNVGKGSIRNMIMVEVSRTEESMSGPAEIGVNGIRMNKAIDGKNTQLLVLKDSKDDPSGEVRSIEFREYAKII